MAAFPVWPLSPDQKPTASTSEWIFEDPRSRTLPDEVEQMAPSNTAALISDEADTGRELTTHYLYSRSARQGGPFVVMSRGASSDILVDAELFDHENGAFAGTLSTQVGWFEQANGGTIFLDEVNDLSLSVQNKLLRVPQGREIVHLGGCTPTLVDLRIVAATTVDLKTLVRERRFRKDLYYRLNVINLNVLTLEGRPDNVAPLARCFINTYDKRLGHVHATLTPAAEHLLT